MGQVMTNRHPPGQPRDLAIRYGVALVSISLATALRRMLAPALGNEFPYATLFFAVLFTAWYGGLGPAILAAGLGALASVLFLIPAPGRLAVVGGDQQVGFIVYL